MHAQPDQPEMACPYCTRVFLQKRRWQHFCSARCRSSYAHDKGLAGTVVSVRRLIGGRASVVLHFEPHDAERVVGINLKDQLMVLKP